ncbi:MAG: O-methyltransferase [Actinomycetota bacterium]|nr:O-methyltransferase [Actinomycetota bacterium]MDH5314316.1 O-methyltransferase [Actinomycetota bacterium]
MDIVDPRVETYIASLHARYDEPVLLEMEAEARALGFPIVGRNVGVTLSMLAASVGAKRVFELGSGFGYSAYWFARATGADGEIHLTDGDAANERKAADYLGRAGVWPRVRYHVGDALTSFAEVPGDFDVVYDDIDKQGYPDAWRAASLRVRVGGLYICDNTLWSGRVPPDGEAPDDVTGAIREHNAMVAGDERFVTTLLPIRDGVLVAVRIA